MPGKTTLFNPAWMSKPDYKGLLAVDLDFVFNYNLGKSFVIAGTVA